jgi:hypothetical protein
MKARILLDEIMGVINNSPDGMDTDFRLSVDGFSYEIKCTTLSKQPDAKPKAWIEAE